MKRRMLAAAPLALLGMASPVSAHLVEVTTSVAVSEADDQAKIIRLLIADQDGEQTAKDLADPRSEEEDATPRVDI